ncbi:GT2 family glycosyltransferase [Luteibacter sp. OK325]|uniref:glycosyltransferase family 2 protein n=1 Tax=Luteibacter sp. OK325 TaxID=2135670 RepID=UPI000D351F0D|nr:glycosyltransferase family 2 protein [Luteibacter sp. OK325]PTR26314.1 GT2 family glycosyltransferase [Luteibacter sp. OK325]
MRKCVAVLLHFRSAAMTLRCLQSLASEGVDIVVVVDNSEDDGASIVPLRSGAAHIPTEVVYLEPGVNLGFAAGVNRAVELIAGWGGEYDLLLINSDASLAPGTVGHLRTAVAGKSPVIAAPSIDGPTGLVPARTYYRHLSATISPAGPGLRGHALLGGACLMLHHTLVHEPIFDETFFFYGDDIEMGYRMAQRGVALVDVPEGVVIHEGSGSSGNGSIFYEYHMSRAHLLLVGRLGYGMAARFGLGAGRFFFLTLRALVRSVRHRSLRPWKGLAMALSDLLRGRRRSLTPPAS